MKESNSRWHKFVLDYHVDHIKEIAKGKTTLEQAKLFFDIKNLQLVCVYCHKEKTRHFLKNKSKSKSQNLKDFF